MKPPTIAPTTPSTISMTMPEPDLLTILLAMNPAMRPKMIHAIMPIATPSRVDLKGELCGMDGENASR